MIDILFLIILLFALVKGIRNGLIVGIFSIIAFIVGIAAAVRFSAAVANRLGSTTEISSRWLPFVSFILVFAGVVILINIGARLLRKTAETIMLGIFDKIGGVLLYLLLYSIIFSILLFYADKLMIIGEEAKTASRVYPYLAPLGPTVIGSLGKFIPFFQDMFAQLDAFFGEINDRIIDQPVTR